MWGLSTFLGMGAAFLSPWGLFCPLHCPSTTPQNPFYAVRRVGKETPFLLFPSPLQPPHAGVETSTGDEAGAGEEGSCWGEAVLGGAEGAALGWDADLKAQIKGLNPHVLGWLSPLRG